MSEKRFTTRGIIISHYGVWDTDDKPYANDDVVDLLNEQQATINALKKENKELKEEWEFSFRTEMAHHRFEEKELKEKIRKQQSTITELNKQNEQLREIVNKLEEAIEKRGYGSIDEFW